MPIVSISKIQHRYGLSENLPQLSAAELGWAIDKRKLYIGNGTTSEGAPTIGNTEILTQYSNLLEVAENAYSYKDVAVGFEAITGESILAPITRNLQSKLDDFANVRDYGAKGDGATDDTEAITRALNDLFTRETSPIVRRVLYMPAGNYLVSSTIKIPPYATIQGEGKNCTFITATDATMPCVARIVDSKLQTGANVGANGAVFPMYVVINDITFSANSLGIKVFLMNAVKNIAFRNVGFDGGATVPATIAGDELCAINITSTAIIHSKNVTFDTCEFSGTNFAVILDDDMENIIFDKCSFKKFFMGIRVGTNSLGSGASINGPRGLRITNSLFDEIFNSAIWNDKSARITSAFNTFLDVGNENTSSPVYPIIKFNGDGSASICDIFSRTDIANLAVPRVSYGNNKAIYIETGTGMFVGKRQLEVGGVLTLTDAAAETTLTNLVFSMDLKTQKIHYIATRGTAVRSGIFEITATRDGYSYADTYTDNGIEMGLTLIGFGSNQDVTLAYTTETTGTDVTFSYSVERNLV